MSVPVTSLSKVPVPSLQPLSKQATSVHKYIVLLASNGGGNTESLRTRYMIIEDWLNLSVTTYKDLKFRGPCIESIFLLKYFQHDATLHSLFIYGKLLYMCRVVSPPIIRSTHNCIYSIWYLSNRYCYLPLLWKSWNWFECGVGNVLICFGAVASA